MRLHSMSNMKRGKLLTLRQAGEQSGLGLRFMRHLVYEGRIDSYKIGSRRFVSEADLDAFIERHREGMTKPD